MEQNQVSSAVPDHEGQYPKSQFKALSFWEELKEGISHHPDLKSIKSGRRHLRNCLSGQEIVHSVLTLCHSQDEVRFQQATSQNAVKLCSKLLSDGFLVPVKPTKGNENREVRASSRVYYRIVAEKEDIEGGRRAGKRAVAADCDNSREDLNKAAKRCHDEVVVPKDSNRIFPKFEFQLPATLSNLFSSASTKQEVHVADSRTRRRLAKRTRPLKKQQQPQQEQQVSAPPALEFPTPLKMQLQRLKTTATEWLQMPFKTSLFTAASKPSVERWLQ